MRRLEHLHLGGRHYFAPQLRIGGWHYLVALLIMGALHYLHSLIVTTLTPDAPSDIMAVI